MEMRVSRQMLPAMLVALLAAFAMAVGIPALAWADGAAAPEAAAQQAGDAAQLEEATLPASVALPEGATGNPAAEASGNAPDQDEPADGPAPAADVPPVSRGHVEEGNVDPDGPSAQPGEGLAGNADAPDQGEAAGAEGETPADGPASDEAAVPGEAQGETAIPAQEPDTTANPQVPAAQVSSAAGVAADDAAKRPIADGTYLFTWAKNLKYIAKSAKNSRKAGAKVVLGKGTTITRQRWIVKYDAKRGAYTIVNEYTRKALAIGKAKKGAAVVQRKAKAGAKSQLWTVEMVGGSYVFHPLKNAKLALGASRVKGSYRLKLAKATGAKAQRFAMKDGGIVRDGVYTMALAKAKGKKAQVKGASKADGAALQFQSATGRLNQKFRITYQGDGQYTIQVLHAGKYVGMKDGQVLQLSDGAAASQRWKVQWNGKGIAFKNVDTGKRLAAASAKVKNKTGVVAKKAAKKAAQRWTLQRTKPVDEDKAAAVAAVALAKAKAKGSATSWFIAVDTKNHRTVVLKRSGGGWKVAKNWVCSTGRANSPTVLGSFTVGAKGYSFGHGYTCYYYTQFYGDYLFHSVPYKEGTFKVKDGRLGQSVSAGCVRLPLARAKWIYNNIPGGTRVVTYK